MRSRQINPWAALAALCVGFFMILLDSTIVSIAVPSMLRELNASLNSVVWVTSVYLLTYAVPMLLASRLGDRFGPKRVFLAGLTVFTLASLWCGMSGSVEMLIVARALQGIGAALMTPQTLAFITHLFPPNKRGSAMGLWGAVAGLATIAGPLLGGVLVDSLGWQWIFYVNVPVGVVALVLTVLLVPDWQPKHSHSFDVPGILLSGAGLLLLVFGLQNGQQYDWGKVWGPFTVFEVIGAGVALLVAFVCWQRFNRSEPLVPLRVFASRNFSMGTLTAVTVGFSLTGMFLPLIIYIQSVLGMSPTMAGLLTAPMSLLSGVVAPFIGRLSDKVNAKYLVMFGLAALAGGLALLSVQAQPTSNPWSLVPALLVCGLGIGSVFSPMSNITMSSVEPRLAGTASGIFNTARQVGGVLGSAAIGVLLQARITVAMHDEAVAAAAKLPVGARQKFLDGVAKAAGSTTEFGSTAGADPAVTAMVHNALTKATSQTLLLPMVVLLLGVLSALAMQQVSRRPDPEPVAV